MIRLEPFTEKDFTRLISWIDTEETMVQFAGPIFNFPITNEQLDIYIEDRNRYAFKAILFPGNEVVGHAEIFLHDEMTAVICRIIIGEKNYRGKGLGLELMQRLMQIAFEELQVEKISLNVFDWNLPAIKCYEKAGFKVNPSNTKTRIVKDETWIAFNMTIDKKDFLNH